MKLDDMLPRRGSGLRIIVISVLLGVAGAVPLLLYLVLGPEDGNPIGLGLLFVLAVAVAIVGVFIGLLTMVVQYFGGSGD